MKRKYSFEAKIGKEVLNPKGFYYQGNFIILVGCERQDHTIRRKERISDVEITIKSLK